MKKQAMIKKLKGIVLSDPSYDKDVWCRYESKINAENWKISVETKILKDDEYNCDYLAFNLVMGKPEIVNRIKISSDSISYPKGMKLKEHTIGMDTACVFIGNRDKLDCFGESLAIRTGSDGVAGTVYEIKEKGLRNPSAIIFLGEFDTDFVDEESLCSNVLFGFDAEEIK